MMKQTARKQDIGMLGLYAAGFAAVVLAHARLFFKEGRYYIYGADGFNGTNAYILKGTTSTLTIILSDGVVSSIQYDAVVE